MNTDALGAAEVQSFLQRIARILPLLELPTRRIQISELDLGGSGTTSVADQSDYDLGAGIRICSGAPLVSGMVHRKPASVVRRNPAPQELLARGEVADRVTKRSDARTCYIRERIYRGKQLKSSLTRAWPPFNEPAPVTTLDGFSLLLPITTTPGGAPQKRDPEQRVLTQSIHPDLISGRDNAAFLYHKNSYRALVWFDLPDGGLVGRLLGDLRHLTSPLQYRSWPWRAGRDRGALAVACDALIVPPREDQCTVGLEMGHIGLHP